METPVVFGRDLLAGTSILEQSAEMKTNGGNIYQNLRWILFPLHSIVRNSILSQDFLENLLVDFYTCCVGWGQFLRKKDTGNSRLVVDFWSNATCNSWVKPENQKIPVKVKCFAKSCPVVSFGNKSWNCLGPRVIFQKHKTPNFESNVHDQKISSAKSSKFPFKTGWTRKKHQTPPVPWLPWLRAIIGVP